MSILSDAILIVSTLIVIILNGSIHGCGVRQWKVQFCYIEEYNISVQCCITAWIFDYVQIAVDIVIPAAGMIFGSHGFHWRYCCTVLVPTTVQYSTLLLLLLLFVSLLTEMIGHNDSCEIDS